MTKLIDATAVPSGGPFANMAVGEVRTVPLATRSENPDKLVPVDKGSRVGKTITRSERSFAADWVDSTNAELAARGIRHTRWVLADGPSMPPRLVDLRFVTGSYARDLKA